MQVLSILFNFLEALIKLGLPTPQGGGDALKPEARDGIAGLEGVTR